jgi:hypothetical protein
MNEAQHKHWSGHLTDMSKPLVDMVREHKRNEIRPVAKISDRTRRDFGIESYDRVCEDYGWTVRFDYTANVQSEYTYCEILSASLVAGGKDIDLPLEVFSKDHLAMVRDEINAELN